MRAGRSMIVECARILRYRRALATLRAIGLLGLGICVCLGAAGQLLVGAFDGPLFCALFIAMMWGAFICAVATWRLL
jgi:uncharacterized integral membrane protein